MEYISYPCKNKVIKCSAAIFIKKNTVPFQMDLNSRAKFLDFCDPDPSYKLSVNK